jgi:hypothetical protein
MILLMLPPLVFLMAEILERDWDCARLRRLYLGSLAGVLAVSLPLAWVDFRYAAAQREFSRMASEKYLAKGRRVFFTGYMGLQYYLEEAGGRGLDWVGGGWDQIRAGDVVAVLKINSTQSRPKRLLANEYSFRVDCPIPLRLMSGSSGEGGFYSNLTGFLPYSLSWEPLEEFSMVEAL